MNGYEMNPDREIDLTDLWKQYRSYLLPVVILVLIVAAALTSVYTVDTEGKAVVKRWGRVVSIKDPGLHLKLPFGIDTAIFVPTERVLKEEFGFRTVEAGQQTRYRQGSVEKEESLMLAGDLSVVDVEWVVQYMIHDPDAFLHHVRNQRESIRDVSEAVMRRVVGNRLGADVLTVGRVEIAGKVREEMQQILDKYELGVHIRTVEMQDVTPPEPVKPAFNEVNEARQQREQLVNEAEKKRNREIPRARGEAEKIVSEAQGFAAERVNRAKGDTARFLAVLKEYRQAPSVTRRRLFVEMMEEVLPEAGGIYVTRDQGPSPLPILPLRDALDRQAKEKK
ncbi:FtsH protease activity modulator HflK [Kiritimatiella glycovorans]|uniref:Protein HflK n=1 Tax=Kiritimatiella glycovorans TaxID=1307763 RepID=A0A0G3EGM6_9BACT|nr:FtsH protease activity modulator HflK [Kiritimatiella glycovorans]AKJ64572.1 Modulator of FtsH protease HflK [Kiritimatiella glycovorans]